MSYRDSLQVLGLESLECRRLNYDLILVYKILHGLIDINLSFQLQASNTRGHSVNHVKPYCSRDIYQHFFTNRIITVWNSLPSNRVLTKSLFSNVNSLIFIVIVFWCCLLIMFLSQRIYYFSYCKLSFTYFLSAFAYRTYDAVRFSGYF